MEKTNRQELYQGFIEFIGNDIQGERRLVNRRMFNVLLWCFLVPATLSFGLFVMIRFGWLRSSARPYLQWMVLTFPVLYSLYILSSEVLTELPQVWKRGGVANTLIQPRKDSQWRERVMVSLARSFPGLKENDWAWIVMSFRIDLDIMKHRTRYLTGLAGAVFYLILQGIDSLSDTDTETKTTWTRSSVFGWIESSSSNDTATIIAFAIVLVLLYLSGSQTHQTLMRYQSCAELMELQSKNENASAVFRS